MQNNVLEKAIHELGIFEGDVIKIPNDEGVDYYQYKNGKFMYLCCNGPMEMEDCEVYDLISGDTYFEIIARGENPFVEDVREYISRIDCVIDDIDEITDRLDELIESQTQEKEKREKQDLYLLWAECGFLAFAVILFLIKLFI